MYNSNLGKLREKDLSGSKVAVGFRPSGSLHVGNLLTVTYAAVLADELGLDLDLCVCDTDWSAHIHQDHLPDENRCMKLFFERECPCGRHGSVAEHRVDEVSEFLSVLRERTVDFEVNYLSEYRSEEYDEALRNILNGMNGFDGVFGGGFRRRYRSPVSAVCEECGFSDAKGSSYSKKSDELVSACRNPECSNGFMTTELSNPEKGVYYLVDPVRDPARDAAVHVFGGDYRDSGKGQKTSKVEKVSKITELACGKTPEYFVAPMIGDDDGKPLSKSHGVGVTVEDIDDLESFSQELIEKTRDWIEEDKEFIAQNKVMDM